MELIDSLERTFLHAHSVIAPVTPGRYDDPTPCEEWNVRQLLEHMIGVVGGFGSAIAGQPWSVECEVSDNPGVQFEAAASTALAAWRRDGVLEEMFTVRAGTMPGRALALINLLDTATHSWDLATATGQPATLPSDVAAAAVAASGQVVTEQLRVGRFGPALDPPPDADATEQLVSFLGRKP